MSLFADDRGASPHERAATDIAHLLIAYALAGLGWLWLAPWLIGFAVFQAIQMRRQWARGLAWGDVAFDAAVTAAGAALGFGVLSAVETGCALIGMVAGLYLWRHRHAWGLAS